jgi:hypothetical protein
MPSLDVRGGNGRMLGAAAPGMAPWRGEQEKGKDDHSTTAKAPSQ